MLCKPFITNELWKSKLEKTHSRSLLQYTVPLIGSHRISKPYHNLFSKTTEDSIHYWNQVKERACLYRLNKILEMKI